MPRRWAPFAVLLAQVLLFFRAPLFTQTWIIPFDLPNYHLPLATHAAGSLGSLRFPLWDNYTYCGFPFYANVQTQLFYPLAWPFFALANLLGLDRMLDLLEWQVALHVWLGGILTWRFLRAQGTSEAAALLGATTFQLGGFFASQAQHLGVVCAAAWLPLAWHAARAGRSVQLAAALAMSYLAGYPAAAVFVGGSAAIVGFLSQQRRAVMLAAPLAIALAGMQLFPALELAAWSGAPQRGEFGGTGGGVPVQGFISLVWPNYHRIFDPAEYKLSWNRSFLYLYCGLLPLGLALVALFRPRTPWWARAMVFITLIWMIGETNPAWRALFPGLPGQLRSILTPEHAIMGFVLSIGTLAALGARGLPERWIWLAVILAWIDLTYTGSSNTLNTGLRSETPLVSSREFEGSAETLAKTRELTHRTLPPARIDIANDSMNWAAAAPVLGIPTATGNDPLCLARIKDVRLLFARGDRWMHYYTVDKPESPILDLLNVRYLVAWEQSPEAGALPQAAALPGHQLRENTNALPRFFLAAETRAAESREAALALLAAPDFDPRRLAIIEAPSPALPASPGEVIVEAYGSSRVRLRVDASGPAFLVSSETYYPGWHAEIDGQPSPIILTNVAFRGLAVPAGTHTVTMRFQPSILWWSLALSAISWFSLAAMALRRRGIRHLQPTGSS